MNNKVKNNNRSKIILIAVILISVVVYFFVPSVNKGINEAVKVMSTQGIDGVIGYIRNYGVYAAAISFGLMVLQSVISPIPAFLITLANAAIFGWVKGAILSWTSSMVGAVLCFFIARTFGRDKVEKMSGKGAIAKLEEFFKKYGKHSVFVARLLPFMSFDLVSYFAGLTSISFPSFLIATGLGQLPATIVYSYVGGELTGGAEKLMIGLSVLFAITVIIYIWRKIYAEKHQTESTKISTDN